MKILDIIFLNGKFVQTVFIIEKETHLSLMLVSIRILCRNILRLGIMAGWQKYMIKFIYK